MLFVIAIIKQTNLANLYTCLLYTSVDRIHNLDTLEVMVEMTPEMFSDSVKNIENIERQMAAKLHTVLNISAKVTLVEPKSIARSEGKAQRIIDKRKI